MQIINKDTTNPINLGQMVIQTLLWILVLYVFMRYCQLNIYVERQYKYLSDIENELLENGLKISREGKNYNENYPVVLCVIDFLYKWFFPILFLGINVIRISTEICWNTWSVSIVCDLLIAIATVCLSISYILTLHPINIKKSQGGR